MPRRVRLGIIGTGIAARDLHWPPLSRMQDRFEIVALCNRTLSKAEDFAQSIGSSPRITSNFQELLSWPEVEAVDILTPIALNAPVTIAALEAGKDIILEKPVAADLASAEQVVASAEAHPDRIVEVAENVRYSPNMTTAQKLITARKIGEVKLIRLVAISPLTPDNPYTATEWRQRPEHLGGYLSDGGVHQAAALHMLGGGIASVQGFVSSFHTTEQETDTLVAGLQFAGGALGSLAISFGVRREVEEQLVVFGTEGSIVVGEDYLLLRTGEGEERIDIPALPNGYDNELADFHAAVTERRQPEVTPRKALDDLRLIDAVFRSSAEGRAVRLDS